MRILTYACRAGFLALSLCPNRFEEDDHANRVIIRTIAQQNGHYNASEKEERP
jgi:ferredoxin